MKHVIVKKMLRMTSMVMVMMVASLMAILQAMPHEHHHFSINSCRGNIYGGRASSDPFFG